MILHERAGADGAPFTEPIRRAGSTRSSTATSKPPTRSAGSLGQVRYDNFTSAVSQVLYAFRRRRDENRFAGAVQIPYGFDPFYCHPGIEGAHEKEGVSGEVGRFRRTWLNRMPEVKTLDELNEKIHRC